MLYFWKTKDFLFFYKVKLSLRNFKYFVNQTYKLIKIGTSFNLVYRFVINNFKIYEKNTDFINKIYKISNFSFPDWFSNKIPILIKIFNKHKFPDKLDILEIGSFEGRSSLFFINYFKNQLLIDDIKITPVEYADEVLKIALTKELKKVEWAEVEKISKTDEKSQASIQ